MKNRTITQSWRLFRRLKRIHNNAMTLARSAASFNQADRALSRANCADYMMSKLSHYLNKHAA